MGSAAGILLLIAGVSFPLAVVFWLNNRMRRLPPLSPGQTGLLLALNGVLPVGLICLGLGLLSARLWATPAIRIAALSALLAAVLLLVALGWLKRHPGR